MFSDEHYGQADMQELGPGRFGLGGALLKRRQVSKKQWLSQAACEQFACLLGRLAHTDTQKLTHGEVEAVIHQEVTVQILDPAQKPEGKRPVPSRKRTWARVEADMGTVIEQGFADAVRRDPDQKMRWVVLMDGQEDLLRQFNAAAKRYKVEITVV
jgi:hypothetical protein